MKHAHKEDDLHCHRHGAEQVRRSRARDDLAQDRMFHHELQAFGDLRPQVPPSGRRSGRLFPGPDAKQRRDRYHIGNGVGRHRPGGAYRRDQAAAETRPGELGERLGGAQLAVAVHQVLLPQQDRQVALVGDVEEHRGHAGRHRHHVQLPEGQDTQRPGQRNRPDDERPRDVAGKHDAPLGTPVHEGARGQGDERERGGRGRGQQAHLEGAGLEYDDRGQRERQLGDGRSHLADALAAPEQHEVTVPPQAPLSSCLRFRRLLLEHREHPAPNPVRCPLI
jgi:hypothetical protein